MATGIAMYAAVALDHLTGEPSPTVEARWMRRWVNVPSRGT